MECIKELAKNSRNGEKRRRLSIKLYQQLWRRYLHRSCLLWVYMQCARREQHIRSHRITSLIIYIFSVFFIILSALFSVFVFFISLWMRKNVCARLMSRLTFVRHCSSSSLSLLPGIVHSPRANNERTSHFAVLFCWFAVCVNVFVAIDTRKSAPKKHNRKETKRRRKQPNFGSEHLYANFFLNTFEWGQSICRIILFRCFAFIFLSVFSLCVFWLSNALSGGACVSVSVFSAYAHRMFYLVAIKFSFRVSSLS